MAGLASHAMVQGSLKWLVAPHSLFNVLRVSIRS
ncbi:hypothetical protein ACVIYL_004450 [Bradyrhizobium sp. USDA 3315]